MPNYWILKSEPSVYDFADLERERRTVWDGVTNALALQHIRSMAANDRALIYHSNAGKALVGLARVVSQPYADPRADDPRRAVVDVEFDRWLPRQVPLAEIKADPAFADLGLVRMSRLSVIPVPEGQWGKLLAMAGVR
ncbi:MAG TPA: EVE domain-containing protein [Gemmatimonadales bacterium]|nr:EVE domain-containing protein [Gemmatimonadales bacterium]